MRKRMLDRVSNAGDVLRNQPQDGLCLRVPFSAVLLLCFVATALKAQVKASSDFLYVWTGSADTTQPDFLAVFDVRPASDRYGRLTTFRSAIIVLTSNLGAGKQESFGFGKQAGVAYEGEALSFFRPEFFNRIDDVIVFHRLTRDEIDKIVQIQLTGLAKTLLDRGIQLTWTPKVRRYLAARGYDPTFGARPLKRLIQKEVGDRLASSLLEGTVGEGDIVELDVAADGESLEISKKPVAVSV